MVLAHNIVETILILHLKLELSNYFPSVKHIN